MACPTVKPSWIKVPFSPFCVVKMLVSLSIVLAKFELSKTLGDAILGDYALDTTAAVVALKG